MDPLQSASTVCLIASIVFGLLWLKTPSGEYYETVDRVVMKKKTAFGMCGLIMLAGWVYLKML